MLSWEWKEREGRGREKEWKEREGGGREREVSGGLARLYYMYSQDPVASPPYETVLDWYCHY